MKGSGRGVRAWLERWAGNGTGGGGMRGGKGREVGGEGEGEEHRRGEGRARGEMGVLTREKEEKFRRASEGKRARGASGENRPFLGTDPPNWRGTEGKKQGERKLDHLFPGKREERSLL